MGWGADLLKGFRKINPIADIGLDAWDDWTGKTASEDNIQFQKDENAIIRQREDNAVQRRANDMDAAGMNRVLAAGAPAQTGITSAPQVDTGIADRKIKSMTMAKDFMVTEAQIRAINAGTNKTEAETAILRPKTDNIKADTLRLNKQAELLDRQITNKGADTVNKELMAEMQRKDLKYKYVDIALQRTMQAGVNWTNSQESKARILLMKSQIDFSDARTKSENWNRMKANERNEPTNWQRKNKGNTYNTYNTTEGGENIGETWLKFMNEQKEALERTIEIMMK